MTDKSKNYDWHQSSDGNDGDEYFTATFIATTSSNGFPGEFVNGPSFSAKKTPVVDTLSEQFSSFPNTSSTRQIIHSPMFKTRTDNGSEFNKSAQVNYPILSSHSVSRPPPSINVPPPQIIQNMRDSPRRTPSPYDGTSVMRSIKSPISSEHSTPAKASHKLQQENVRGTMYFYTDDTENQQSTQSESISRQQGIITPNYTMHVGPLPNIAHSKERMGSVSYFISDDLKAEILKKQAITLLALDPEQNFDIPRDVDNYTQIFPLELQQNNINNKSSIFLGYTTSVYKALNTKDNCIYCLRRIHGFRLTQTKSIVLVDAWKNLEHSNIVSLRQVFTTKAFHDNSIVFVYDYFPGAETVMGRHFSDSPQKQTFLPENLIWSYVVQLSSAIRLIHSAGLACRIIDPSKILLMDKSRMRFNCVGILDILTFESNQNANPAAIMAHFQQEDLTFFGKVILALACNSVAGTQRDRVSASIELVARNFSNDLRNVIVYLLNPNKNTKTINDIMPMIGARFYTQLDSAQLRCDVLENELSKEIENGRLFRLISKLGLINERGEHQMDPSWSETGDRYMLKLFRDYLFHQVDSNGLPWVDLAHIVSSLNKLDAGSSERICLSSRDEQTVLLVTYAELKGCFETAISELINPAQQLNY